MRFKISNIFGSRVFFGGRSPTGQAFRFKLFSSPKKRRKKGFSLQSLTRIELRFTIFDLRFILELKISTR